MNDVIIVGGGVAGLTASAYLARSGLKPLLLEKGATFGGLVGSFEREGFKYDNGVRAIEDSGILFPMLKQLGIEIEFLKNPISLGIEDKVIWIKSEEDISAYQKLLESFYPESSGEILEIIDNIKKIMEYMEVQYGIDNPAFIENMNDVKYLLGKIMPWAIRYIITVPKINGFKIPVVKYLEKYTQNRALIDNITQHFFKDTPTYFALSYLKIYLDYYYPIGGTRILPQKLEKYIEKNGGELRNNTEVTSINPIQKFVIDSEGKKYDYRQLIWAADQKSLYNKIDPKIFVNKKISNAIAQKQTMLKDSLGNDSVFILYIAVNKSPSYFADISSGHFFYTPSRLGLSTCGPIPINSNREKIEEWLGEYSKLTTYEISIPALRDQNLAPPGKTGLMISTLFDYHLTRKTLNEGWYSDFKELFEKCILNTVEKSVYPRLTEKLIHRFSSTPIDIEKRTANTHGAITGWSFTNKNMPSENRLSKIFDSTDTPIPGIVQAGQWTYSPSGLPISILTGKLAADKVINILKKSKAS